MSNKLRFSESEILKYHYEACDCCIIIIIIEQCECTLLECAKEILHGVEEERQAHPGSRRHSRHLGASRQTGTPQLTAQDR